MQYYIGQQLKTRQNVLTVTGVSSKYIYTEYANDWGTHKNAYKVEVLDDMVNSGKVEVVPYIESIICNDIVATIPAKENTMTIENTIQRIIDQEIHTGCNQLVQHLSEGLNYDSASLAEIEPQLFFKEDKSELPTGFTITQDENGAYIVLDEDGDEMAYSYDEDEAIEEAWDNASEEPPTIEALQFWIVSDWLADKLEDVGALVAHDVLGFAIWGRSECGQCLTMDSDLNAVARLLERS